MTTAALNLSLLDARVDFAPGETLAVEYNLDPSCADEIERLEISVLWFTEGKGDEDMAVHFFERIERETVGFVDFRRPRKFETVLPTAPLSYEGMIVKIHWCVRPCVSDSRQTIGGRVPLSTGQYSARARDPSMSDKADPRISTAGAENDAAVRQVNDPHDRDSSNPFSTRHTARVRSRISFRRAIVRRRSSGVSRQTLGGARSSARMAAASRRFCALCFRLSKRPDDDRF